MSKKFQEEDEVEDVLQNLSDSSESEQSDSSSSGSSSSESGSESDSGEEKQRHQKKAQWEESDSDVSEKRVIKSQSQKRLEKMKELITKMKVKLDIKDFSQLYDLYEELNKELLKHKIYFDKNGIPKMYIYYIYWLEQQLKALPTSEKQKLSTANNKAFNTLKQKLKKNRVNHITELEKCEQNPDDYYNSDRDDKGSDDEQATKKKKNADDSSESEDEDNFVNREMRKYRNSNDPQIRRKYWMKKSYLFPHLFKDEDEDKASDSEEEQKEKKERRRKEQQEAKLKKQQEDDLSNFNIKDTSVKDIDIKDHDEVEKFLRNVVSNRNSFSTAEKQFNYHNLERCFQKYSDKQERALEIIMILLPVCTDFSKTISPSHMPRIIWNTVLQCLQTTLQVLKTKKQGDLEVQTFNPMTRKVGNEEKPIEFEDDEQQKNHVFHSMSYMKNQLSTYIVTLEGELYNAFKYLDFTNSEYNLRISDQFALLNTIKSIQEYYQSLEDMETVARIAFRRLANLYFIHDSQLEGLRKKATENKKNYKFEFYAVQDSEKQIRELCQIVQQHSNNQSNQIRAILYQIYHHAIHDRTQQAKEIMLMTHLPQNEFIQKAASQHQLLYLRFLAQQGLAYFRQGNYKDANLHLREVFVQVVFGKRQLKEVLGQNIGKTASDYDKKVALPYHMHINIELVETVHLIVGMILDLPALVSVEKKVNLSSKQRNVSFKAFYDSFNSTGKSYKNEQKVQHKTYNGPVENNQEILNAASRAIMRGTWEEANQYISRLNIWSKIHNGEQAKNILFENAKECSYKCYLLYYKSFFQSLSLNQLSKQFNLPINRIKTITSKFINNL
ncbi:hypothetical protein PPERSA_06631 [Pseudocohnilembus persalinus]|uniref:PCI domain-containing protein n=1 Tax=Pseudocohnilembus persalinus TaxID=266149 RepID=A0A0V0QSV3_PSEPJ|nr:hypothetical protein PPERSA_06631 [Pseudocohnilembus persalinus]|eukprot:KRX04997.1 hypothetical protein PPERSA_06631 [Pseudocohnilembus persalinus]